MVDPSAPEDHEARVHESFDSLQRQVGDRLDELGREAIEKLRAAAAARDGEALRTGLNELRERHGWLYKELAAHPRIANLLDELALLGL
ncbi:MAG TPA: hypothetical protein VGL03_15885 [Thermoanaerobaculia bacterium]|jgi:ubiquinone biosynthesis protein UbiJ